MDFDLSRLDDGADRLERAKAHVEVVKNELKALAQEALDAKVSEVQIHKRLRVDRGTVRSWLGKPRG